MSELDFDLSRSFQITPNGASGLLIYYLLLVFISSSNTSPNSDVDFDLAMLNNYCY